MKTSGDTEAQIEAQINAIVWQAEGGVPVAHLCREHGMDDQTAQISIAETALWGVGVG